jgi:hypothetical protein
MAQPSKDELLKRYDRDVVAGEPPDGFVTTADDKFVAGALYDMADGAVKADGSVPMSGPLTLIGNDPANPNHATRKSYVDGKVAQLSATDSTLAGDIARIDSSLTAETAARQAGDSSNASAIIDLMAQLDGVTVTGSGGLTGGGDLSDNPALSIADSGVTTAKIADGAITSAKIADGTIVNADVASNAAIDVSKVSGAATSAALTAGLNAADTNLDAAMSSLAGGLGNLLTEGQAGFEDGGTGDAYMSATNGFLANSSGQAAHGTRSLAATYTSAVANIAVEFALGNGKRVPVEPGGVYTFTFSVRASQPGEQFDLVAYTYNSSNTSTPLGTSATQTVTDSGWTRLSVTAVIPAGAVTATVAARRKTAGAGVLAYFDRIGIWRGAGGLWAPPGRPITNLGTYTDESVGRRIFTWDGVNNRWQMTYGDTGWRNVTDLAIAAGKTKFPNAVMYIRRVNNTITVRWYGGTGVVEGVAVTGLLSLPTGFKPGALGGRGPVGQFLQASNGRAATHGFYSDGGVINGGFSADTCAALMGELSAPTSDPWPTTLPGTAEGTIPTP